MILVLIRLIFLLFFSGGIIISSTGSTAILFHKNSPVVWNTFLEANFKESTPVSNNCFLYFLANDKNLYPLTYFLVFGSIEYPRIDKFEERVISIY